ncbi:MAG: fused MFS/spermidine synthase, partial [Planctomycetota bacterium]
SNVFQALGILLLLAAAASLLLFRSGTGRAGAVDRGNAGVLALLALAFGEAWFVFPIEPSPGIGQRLLHYEDSSYHEILVTEDVLWPEGSGGTLAPVKNVHRWLKFNENIESGIYPYVSEYSNAVSYTDLLHLPLIWINNPLPQRVLVVGGGGGVIPTQYSTWYNCQVDVAELDPAVKRIAIEYFQVPQPPASDKIHFYLGDGRQTLRRVLPDNTYDVVFLDAYSSGGQIPFHLLTWEFLAEAKAKLNERGVLLTNIISGLANVSTQAAPRPADLFLAEYKTLKASRADATGDPNADRTPLFKQVYVFPRDYPKHPIGGQNVEEYRNVIMIATREEQALTIDELAARLNPLIESAKPVIKAANMKWHVDHLHKGPSQKELDSVDVLRDDYAPVDTMYRPVKRDEFLRSISDDWE